MNRVLILLCAAVASTALAAPVQLTLSPAGIATIPAPGARTTVNDTVYSAVPSRAEVDIHAFLSGGPTPGHALPTAAATPNSSRLSILNPRFSGFDGLTHLDQRLAGTGIYTNTQFSTEPPDQGLCVGNGYVLETVNTAFAIYDESGTLEAGPVAANQFFGLAPEFDRVNGIVGDTTSDPRCFYDWSSNRWMITILQEDANDPRTHTLIAVSRTGNPLGAWDAFAIDTTNDGQNGTPAHPGCPCFGDQPLLGADENAIFITTNEFGTGTFNGAQVYAIGKAAFSGAGSVVLFDNLTLAEGIAYSVQPATTPPGGKFARGHGGTEFFASSLEFTGGLDDRIAVWAMTGTKSLNGNHPRVSLNKRVVQKTLVYGVPPDAQQKDGPTPLRDLLNSIEGPGVEPLELLATNDDRMQQAIYSGGTLWTALTTVVKPRGDNSYRAGVAWFKLDVDADDNKVKAEMDDQGYIARTGLNVFFPSIAVTARGNAAIGVSVSGPAIWPSAGYAVLRDGRTGPIHISAAGAAPDDGFSGYYFYGGFGSGRWGDYSAAVAGADGSIWMANEYVPDLPRTALANWGTFVARVNVNADDCD